MTSSQPPSSSPSLFFALPNFAAFRATTNDAGAEPWVTDGNAVGTFRLRDLVPGSGSSTPVMLGEYQGELLFSARLPGAGYQLFLSDGTTAGTRSIGNLGLTLPVTYLRLANGNALLQAANTSYATDLTATGTQLIPGMRQFVAGATLGGNTVGTCLTMSGSVDLWATDGTVAGSRLLQAGVSTRRPANFVAHNGRAYFVDVATANQVWISSTDGLSAATRHVLCASEIIVPPPSPLFRTGNRFVFHWPGLHVGASRLFASDLTVAGSGFVSTPCQDHGSLTEFGGNLYLRATTAAAGYELWTTDGTTAGTTQVADLVPGSAGSHPEQLRVTPHGLFFRALDGQGRALMRLLAPNNIQNLGPIPMEALASGDFVAWQDGLLFAANDSAGTELWFGGATRAPARVLDINNTAPGIEVLPAMPGAAARDRLFFVANDGTHGRELWSSDGSSAGTRLLDTAPGPTAGFSGNGEPTLGFFRDRIAFAANQQTGLTDGTAANTTTLLSQSNSNGPLRIVDGQIYFLANTVLHSSDGTAAGTQQVPGASSTSVADYHVLRNRIVFLSGAQNVYGTDGLSFRELLVPAAAWLLGVVDERVVVTSNSGIYATDGTVAGTVQLTNQPFALFPPVMATSRSAVYAIGVDYRVWQSDGTVAGTFPVVAVPLGMTLESLHPTEHELFAVATTAATGRELWKVDRSSGQFVLVADLAPGIASGVAAASVLGHGDLLFLAAGDEVTGSEVYVSDGTAAGTRLVADVHAGRGSSNPRLLGIADAKVYFTADDGVHGNELWVMPIALVGAAHQQEIGYGCLGSAGIPTIAATAVPRLGAANFGYELRSVRSLAPVLLGIATDDAVVPFGSCALHLGGTISTQFGFATVGGSATFNLPVPTVGALVGLRLAAQGFSLDGLAAAGFAASNGILVVVGT